MQFSKNEINAMKVAMRDRWGTMYTPGATIGTLPARLHRRLEKAGCIEKVGEFNVMTAEGYRNINLNQELIK